MNNIRCGARAALYIGGMADSSNNLTAALTSAKISFLAALTSSSEKAPLPRYLSSNFLMWSCSPLAHAFSFLRPRSSSGSAGLCLLKH